MGADAGGVGRGEAGPIAVTRLLVAAAALVAPAAASAHGFGRLYNLPVPFWLYAWGAAAALLLSFVVAARFASAAPAAVAEPKPEAPPRPFTVARAIGVALLLLTIATALFGNRDPYRNFSMTFFWIVFLLGFTYFTALAGNFFDAVNPWRVFAFARGRLRYPQRLGDWPALALFLALIWFELYNHGRPVEVGAVLLGYTVLNALGAWLVGADAWFRHCECFSVFFRLAGLLRGRLSTARPTHLATVVFVLAMLATTAFDGFHQTQLWVRWFWSDPARIAAYAVWRPRYIAWETAWLLASPFLYLGAYLVALELARRLARTPRSLRELALDFAYPLLPIALAYHATHYATLLLSGGPKVVSLLSDPFGWGWNLLGTAQALRRPILPDMGLVWHAQVGLILLGHVAGVVAAHRVALRVWPDRREAMRSQVPMLALMVFFTVVGLWILAQPLTAELMR